MIIQLNKHGNRQVVSLMPFQVFVFQWVGSQEVDLGV
jgi:hypothetical protein